MPTLVVQTRQLQDAREFLRDLAVQAEIVAFEGREKEPKPADVPRLAGAEVAFVGVRKEYRRAAARLGCTTRFEVESIRGAAAALADWLRPNAPPAGVVLTPRAAFEAGAREEGRLILAIGALDTADLLIPALHAFVSKAVTALRDFVEGDARAPQSLERFFADRGIAFAPSGGHAFRYRVVDGNDREILPLTPKQHKHLKKGDHKKTPAECARIYFGILNESVVVARCGPHPEGDFDVTVRKP